MRNSQESHGNSGGQAQDKARVFKLMFRDTLNLTSAILKKKRRNFSFYVCEAGVSNFIKFTQQIKMHFI